MPALSLLSIVIPARDEEGCIASTVEHLHVELKLRGVPHEASAEEIKTFIGNGDSMKGGFTGTMEQLEAYLKGVKS